MEPDRAAKISRGLQQRFEAVAAFLNDVYTHSVRPAFTAKCPIALSVLDRIPKSLVGMKPQESAWTWITSTDIFVRQNGEPLVLDHNLACPVGLHRLAELCEGIALPQGRIGQWTARAVSPESSQTDLAVLDAGPSVQRFERTSSLLSAWAEI